MNTMLRRALFCFLLPAAACDGKSSVDSEPSGQQTAATIPVLGQGAATDRHTSELWVQNGWAYTGTWGRRGNLVGNVLKVWDVSGNTPVLRDSVIVSDATTLGDVQASDDGRLLVVSTEGGRGSIVIYSLADPAKPREIARHSTENTRPGVHTAEVARVGGILYAFLSIPGLTQVVIVDLSDPASPREHAVLPTGQPFTHDVFVRDGLLFTAGWNGGTTLWDIGGGGRGGSPAKPVQISTAATAGGKAHNVWWYHDAVTSSKRYLFVGEEGPATLFSSASGDVHVVDINDPANPREVAFFSVPGAGTHNFSVDERSGILYAAYYNGGVRALNVRGDLATCSAEQKDGTGRCDLGRMGREIGRGLLDRGTPVFIWGVQLVGDTLYASDMLNGLWKLATITPR